MERFHGSDSGAKILIFAASQHPAPPRLVVQARAGTGGPSGAEVPGAASHAEPPLHRRRPFAGPPTAAGGNGGVGPSGNKIID